MGKGTIGSGELRLESQISGLHILRRYVIMQTDCSVFAKNSVGLLSAINFGSGLANEQALLVFRHLL